MTGHFDRFDRPNLHFELPTKLYSAMPNQQILMDVFATLQKYFAFKDTGETAAAAFAK